MGLYDENKFHIYRDTDLFILNSTHKYQIGQQFYILKHVHVCGILLILYFCSKMNGLKSRFLSKVGQSKECKDKHTETKGPIFERHSLCNNYSRILTYMYVVQIQICSNRGLFIKKGPNVKCEVQGLYRRCLF